MRDRKKQRMAFVQLFIFIEIDKLFFRTLPTATTFQEVDVQNETLAAREAAGFDLDASSREFKIRCPRNC